MCLCFLLLADISAEMNHFHGVYEDHPVKLDPGKPFFAIGKMFKPQIGDAVVELATDLKSVYRLVQLTARTTEIPPRPKL